MYLLMTYTVRLPYLMVLQVTVLYHTTEWLNQLQSPRHTGNKSILSMSHQLTQMWMKMNMKLFNKQFSYSTVFQGYLAFQLRYSNK